MMRALGGEALKLRRTLALRLAIVVPLAATALQFLVFCQNESYLLEIENAWLRFVEQEFVFWALLMLPLLVTLQTALLAGLEHGSSQWKHLYALPLPRWAPYAAKQVSAMFMIGLSTAALVAFSLVAGTVLRLIKPGLGFEHPVPWSTLLNYAAFTFLASWLIISIHTWVSLRWRSFVVAVSSGVVMTVAGMVAVQSELGSFYPWAIAGALANSVNKGMELGVAELLFGSLGGLLAAALGCRDFVRRDVL